MTAAQVTEVLRARWRLAGGTFAAALALAVALTLLLPRQYTAAAAVVIDVKSADPIAGLTSPALTAPSYMATQVDIMESDRVATQVVRAMKMTASAETRQQWLDDTGGNGNFDVWLAQRLRRKLDVRPARESNVIEVRFTSADGRFAAAVANAFAQAYLGILLELRTDPARRYSAFFEARARQLRDELEAAQRRLSAFQTSHGILASEERLDVETARMNDLSSQLVGLQAASADSRSRDVAAATAGSALQDVMANPVVAGLRTELGKQEARLQEISQRFGERHPQVLEQQASIASLRAKEEQETRRVASSLQVGSIISESRESQVRAALEGQRERMLRMKGQRTELAVLQRDAELAQRAYDGVVARLSQVNLESQSTQTNAALLTEATEPSQASFPRWSVNLPLGLFAGVLGALAAALAREAADRRVRTRDDVLRGLRVPVFGTLLASPQGKTR